MNSFDDLEKTLIDQWVIPENIHTLPQAASSSRPPCLAFQNALSPLALGIPNRSAPHAFGIP